MSGTALAATRDRLRAAAGGAPVPAVVSGAPKRIRPTLISPTIASTRYVFKRFARVYDDATLAALRLAYADAERRVEELGVRTLADGSYVYREGRYDVALEVPRREVSDFALGVLAGGGAGVKIGENATRAMLVPGPTDAQAWHKDLATAGRAPRYLTLFVALEDQPANADGATEFRVPATNEMPSGLLGFDPDDEALPVVRLRLRANEGILFDGRILHRGGPSRARRPPMVYSVYAARGLEENV